MRFKKNYLVLKQNIMYVIFGSINFFTRRMYKSPSIMSIEDTIDKIINDRVSVSRFGDGEFRWMYNLPQDSFQINNELMRKRLIEVIQSDEENHIICLSDTFGCLKQYNHFSKKWWTIFMGRFRKRWIKLLRENKTYYNTNISRPYMDYKDKTPCKSRFEKLKLIWEKRDVLIVEGEKSRLGVGNDLFNNCASIRRILAPSINAFEKYEELLEEVAKINQDTLILIALGPTATILAYDLSLKGYQAIDIGHVDIEYEWFLINATEKVPIKHKFTNEATAIGGREVSDIKDIEYSNQIIKAII